MTDNLLDAELSALVNAMAEKMGGTVKAGDAVIELMDGIAEQIGQHVLSIDLKDALFVYALLAGLMRNQIDALPVLFNRLVDLKGG